MKVQKKIAEGKWQGKEGEKKESKRENGRIEVVANIVSLTYAFPALHLGISHLTKSGKNANFSQELKNKGKVNLDIFLKRLKISQMVDWSFSHEATYLTILFNV